MPAQTYSPDRLRLGVSWRRLLATQRRLVMLLAILFGLGLLALAPRAGPATAQEEPADPVSALHAYVNAYNSGDAVAAAATFTDNAVWVRPPASGLCSQQTPCLGRAAILSRLQDGVADNQCLTILDTTVIGSAVAASIEVRSDSIRASGIERIRNVWLVQVSQGKLAALYVVNDLTDPQTNQFRAIQVGTQAPGEPIPSPATPCGSD
jgi:hypothetical protein